jgi:hypothetical protein
MMLAFPGEGGPETFGIGAGTAVGIAKVLHIFFFDAGKMLI